MSTTHGKITEHHSSTEKGKISTTMPKQESLPLACFTAESCVVKCPVNVVWDCLKQSKFDKILPSSITSCKVVSGNCCELGMVISEDFTNGENMSFRLVEISELRHTLSFEVIDSTSQLPFSSMVTTIKMKQITEDNTTFICWETVFSNDVSVDVIRLRKERVLSYFKDIKSCCEGKC
jgi:hypothetical protein